MSLPPLTHDRIPVQEQSQNTCCRFRWLFNFAHWGAHESPVDEASPFSLTDQVCRAKELPRCAIDAHGSGPILGSDEGNAGSVEGVVSPAPVPRW